MAGWTAEAIARIQAQGHYQIERESNAANDGRKATLQPQRMDPFTAQAEGHPGFGTLAQPHMHMGSTRHGLKVRVKGEEMGISPPWDEFTIAEPRLPLQIDTRTSLRQAPPMQPVEFRTWEWLPQDAAKGR